MLIALDYDGTYTEDPKFWEEVIRAAKIHGHTVIVATMRHEDGVECKEVKEIFAGKVDRIIFTGRAAKLIHLNELGINPDIWIDDNPVWLFQNG
jgi:hydroxymethylpyrimidine pyrophosphatase-like HAD family hydrolase